MAKVHVSTTINGEPAEFLCEPNDIMLDALRGPLGLTGSKEGCASGDCGACSITLDDQLVCSCLMLAVESEGHELRTIEGLAHGEKLHPLQQKFLEMAALQCGICTSGMLVASDALLRKNPQPSEEEVRFWLAGNLCRCTGYNKIVRAVMETGAVMLGIQDMRWICRNVMARERALFPGHPVAAVAATTEAIAAQACELIEVDYEVLPFAIEIDDALKPDAPILHDFTKFEGKPSNIAGRLEVKKGDVSEGFKQAEVVVERTFTTRPVHQGYIEQHACLVSGG